jgi:hypothetical protein
MIGDITYAWIQLNPSAPHSKSYNRQMFADSLGILVCHPSGAWLSNDGRRWIQIGLTDIVTNQGFLDCTRFKGYIYGLETFEGNIERHTQSSQVARTANCKTREIVAKTSGLPKRIFYHPFVFHEKMWIVGGRNETEQFADVWVSPDGLHRTMLTSQIAEGEILD